MNYYRKLLQQTQENHRNGPDNSYIVETSEPFTIARAALNQWRIQGGGVWGNCRPPNSCGAPLKWRPSDKNVPLFGAHRSRNEAKNTQSKLNNALHFVELQYLRDGL